MVSRKAGGSVPHRCSGNTSLIGGAYRAPSGRISADEGLALRAVAARHAGCARPWPTNLRSGHDQVRAAGKEIESDQQRRDADPTDEPFARSGKKRRWFFNSSTESLTTCC